MNFLLLSILFYNFIVAGAATDEQIRQLLARMNRQKDRITEVKHQQRVANQVSDFPVTIPCLNSHLPKNFQSILNRIQISTC